MTEILLDLYRHHVWANLRVLDYCEAHPDLLRRSVAGTYGSPEATLHHIVASEEGYTGRLRGAWFPDALDEDAPFPGFDDARRRVRRSGEALIEAAATTPVGTTYRIDDGRFDSAAALHLVQAINHGTEHRAHIVTTMSALGAEPVGLDAWEWGLDTGTLREVT